jgi:hypothetical protein
MGNGNAQSLGFALCRRPPPLSTNTPQPTPINQNFGARDPFAAEIESNFGEKVLGNWNTDHIIK